MGWAAPSGPDQLPAGPLLELVRTSLRLPEAKLKASLLEPLAVAVSTTEPDSSSEPAMRRAVPERVTSVRVWPPLRAFRDCCRSCSASGLDVAVCWAAREMASKK